MYNTAEEEAMLRRAVELSLLETNGDPLGGHRLSDEFLVQELAFFTDYDVTSSEAQSADIYTGVDEYR